MPKHPCPDWLTALPRGATRFDVERFLSSSIVFYPGAGSDGHLLLVFAREHAAHCFLYADDACQHGRPEPASRPRFSHPLDVTQAPEAWHKQVLQTIASRLRRLGDGPPEIPFFGAATGFVVNHAPDRAVRFDHDGVELEVLPVCRRVPLLARRGAGGRAVDPQI